MIIDSKWNFLGAKIIVSIPLGCIMLIIALVNGGNSSLADIWCKTYMATIGIVFFWIILDVQRNKNMEGIK